MLVADAVMSSSTQNYSDGSVYVGEWNAEGLKHGHGRLTYSSKTVFTGQFDRGFHAGSGVLVIPDASNKYVVVAVFD